MARIAKYLRGTTDYALCYSASKIPHQLSVYVDADYAGDLDDRHSRSGVVVFMNSGPVLWLSRKQKCVATSTTESEYIAAATGSKETKWLRRLVRNLGLLPPGPSPLLCDNQAAVRLVKNPEYHKRTKHIDTRYHCIREHQERGIIDASYISTDMQIADVFTKALSPEKFLKFRHSLNIVQLTAPQVRD